jgi:hypothetical protein
MENAVIHQVSEQVDTHTIVTKNQQKNLDSLIRISHTFHSDAGIRSGSEIPVSEKLLVLESGHQPNFLPYPGVWKKVFMLQRISGHLRTKDCDALALFGFADQNLSTAKLLYENKVPAVNKQGNIKFGFKIRESEKWKRFNTIKKPSEDDWEQELHRLKNYYTHYLPKGNTSSDSLTHNIDTLTEIMEMCYSRADNMADLNAFIFARICQDLFDIHVHFFRYSDVQQECVFREEWKRILDSVPIYSLVYNKIIHENNINLAPLPSGFVPFWYHCSCGAKVMLLTDSVSCGKGICPECSTEFSFPLFSEGTCLADLMQDMGLSAVARNIVFSEGLGTRLFVSGSGGGLRYGRVANEISRILSFHIPVTLAWQSHDYYIGVVHKAALKDALNFFNLTFQDLTTGSFDERIIRYRRSLQEHIEILKHTPEHKKEMAKFSGLYRNTSTQINIIKKTFSTIPSILDLLVNFPASSIISQWDHAMNSASRENTADRVLLKRDICYRQDTERDFTLPEIPRIYHSLELIEL